MTIGWFAWWYRWAEYAAFGRLLERRRAAFLHRLHAAQRVLTLGEGDGRALLLLTKAARHAAVETIELSPEMIQLARRRLGHSPRVVFREGDAAGLPLAGPFDAVVTHFFLDCFPEEQAGAVIQRLARVLTPGGLWIVTEFAIPAQGWKRVHAQVWVWIMYRFFRLATGLQTDRLPPIHASMKEAGMHLLASEEERWGMVRSELWEKSVA